MPATVGAFAEDELSAKFRKCATYAACRLSPAVVDAVMNTLIHLEDVDDLVEALLFPLSNDSFRMLDNF